MDRAGPRTAEPGTCPSGRCREGASLLGVLGPDGRIGYVTPAMPVTPEFVERANRTGRTGVRFRFAEPCATHACEHWGEAECRLVERLVATAPDGPAAADLPRCGIRATCRWFAQQGRRACAVCPVVLREPSELISTTADQRRSIHEG